MDAPRTPPRFAEITNRLNKLISIGGSTIIVFTQAAMWGRWRSFFIILAVQLLALAGNILYNVRFMHRCREQGELVRSLLNTAVTLVICHLASWPLAQWLVLPYVALVSSEDGAGKYLRFSLATSCVVLGGFAVANGVPLPYPVCFSALTWFCFEVSRARAAALTEMLAESDHHRRELEQSHVLLSAEVVAREQMEVELRHAQKLEAVGRLAAGIAHEINTPVQFVRDSVQFISEAMNDCDSLMHRYQALVVASRAVPSLATEADAITKLEHELDLEFLVTNMPLAATRSLDGLGRIATIVRSLKEFAHPGQHESHAVDLNQAIASTLTIAAHEFKLVADLETSFAELPLIRCRIGEINQVVLNLVVNAAHAIGDVVGTSGNRGTIRVATAVIDQHVVVEIADSGAGIPVALQDRIFEPFFTTKPVGQGTGQGLALARSVIEKHGGKLSFASVSGEGTTFTFKLPITN